MLLFSAEEWAELREGFGLSADIRVAPQWLDVRVLYQAELAWALYREKPWWSPDYDLGERFPANVSFTDYDAEPGQCAVVFAKDALFP